MAWSLYISRGSLYELEAQVYISMDMDHVSKDKSEIMLNKITVCKKLLNGFINYYKKSKHESKLQQPITKP